MIYRLTVEDLHDKKNEELGEHVFNLVGTLEKTPAYTGKAGVTKPQIVKALNKPGGTIRNALDALQAEGRIRAVGTTKKGAHLFEQCL